MSFPNSVDSRPVPLMERLTKEHQSMIDLKRDYIKSVKPFGLWTRGWGYSLTRLSSALATSAVVISALTPAAWAIELSRQEPDTIARESCKISSPDYSGACGFTVVTIGRRRDMNIHFDLSRKGDIGITFGGINVIKNEPESVTMSFGFLAWRSPTLNPKKVEGICVISKPTAAKQDYSCKSNDGRYEAIGSGVVKDYSISGRTKLKRGDYEGSIEDYSRAIAQDPKDAMAYANRAYAKIQIRDLKGAIRDYGNALKIDPEFPDLKGVYQNLGQGNRA